MRSGAGQSKANRVSMRTRRRKRSLSPVASRSDPSVRGELCVHHRPARLSWARLLNRVFELDLEHRPNCGGELKLIAAILRGDREDPHAPGSAGPRSATLTRPRSSAASGLTIPIHYFSCGAAPRAAGIGCAGGLSEG